MKNTNAIKTSNILNASNIILNKFIGKTTDKMNKKQFIMAFLSTLLLINPSYDYENMDKTYFNQTMSLFIQETSLCKPEADFFEEMLHIEPNTADAYLDLYNHTKDLNKCQLGSIIMQMLIYTKSNIILI